MDLKFARSLTSSRNCAKELFGTIFFGVRGAKSPDIDMTAIDCAIDYAKHVGHSVIVRYTEGTPNPKGNHDHWYGTLKDTAEFQTAFKKANPKVFFEILPANLPRHHYLDIEWNPATLNRDPNDPDWSYERIVENIIEKVNKFAEETYGVKFPLKTQILQAGGVYAAKNWNIEKPSFHVKFNWGFKDIFQARHFKTLLNKEILSKNDYYTTWYDVEKKVVKSILDPAPYSRNQAWRCAYNHKLEDLDHRRILQPVMGSKKNFKAHLVGIYDDEPPQDFVFLQADLQSVHNDKVRQKYTKKEANRVSNVPLDERLQKIPLDLLKKAVLSFGPDRVNGYEEWIRTGFGIFNVSYAGGYLEEGLKLFHSVSKKAENSAYDSKGVDYFWSSITYRPDCIGWSCLRAWFWNSNKKYYQQVVRGDYREFMLWVDMAEVRAHYMPDYERLESLGFIMNRYASKHVQDIDLDSNDIVCVRSPMGSRKTKAVIDLIASGKYARILVIMPRKALSQDFLGKANSKLASLNDSEYILAYLKPDKLIFNDDVDDNANDESAEAPEEEEEDEDDYKDLNKYDRLGIQVESIHRVDCATYDLVIIDESEAVLSQFSSPTMKKLKRCKEVFQNLFASPAKFVLMDAMQTNKTYNAVNALKGDKRVQVHVNLGEAAESEAAQKRYAVPIIADSGKARGNLLARAVIARLRKGEKCGVYSTSQRFAVRLKKRIAAALPTKSCMLYDSRTDGDVKNEHFRNVDKYWSQYDVVIYTPTVSVGVSFEIPDYFDCLFVYAYNQSCPMQDIFQGTARIRKLKSDTMYFALIDDSFRGQQLALIYSKVLGQVQTHGGLMEKYILSDDTLKDCPNDSADAMASLVSDLADFSADEIRYNRAVQQTLLNRLCHMKEKLVAADVNDWLLDVHVRNEWGKNITNSNLTFAKVFEDYCGLTNWALQGSVTESTLTDWEGTDDAEQTKEAAHEVPDEERYINIPVLTQAEHAKCQKRILRGDATRLEHVAAKRYWFDNEFVQNTEATGEQKAVVFDEYSQNKDKERLMYYKFAELCRDPDEMSRSKMANNPYPEMFSEVPIILKAIKRMCRLVGLKNTNDEDAVITHQILAENETELADCLTDLKKLLKLRLRQQKPSMATLRYSLGSVLWAFGGAKLDGQRDRIDKGKNNDGTRNRGSVYSYRVRVEDQYQRNVLFLLQNSTVCCQNIDSASLRDEILADKQTSQQQIEQPDSVESCPEQQAFLDEKKEDLMRHVVEALQKLMSNPQCSEINKTFYRKALIKAETGTLKLDRGRNYIFLADSLK